MSQLQVILHNVKNYVHFRLSCLEPFFTRFFLDEQAVLPSGTISDRYGNGSNEEQVYFRQIKQAVIFFLSPLSNYYTYLI